MTSQTGQRIIITQIYPRQSGNEIWSVKKDGVRNIFLQKIMQKMR